ncbi:MAG: hypothetical protein ACFB6S_11220 [Geminicoccaceae bacterium]
MSLGRISLSALAILGVLAGGLGLVTYLNLAKFRQTLVELEASRFEVVAREIVDVIENGMSVGLALDQMEHLEAVLDNARRLDRDILAIDLLSASGETLVTRGEPGTEPLLATSRADQAPGRWHAVDPAGYQLSLPITNSFGVPAGAVVLRYGDEDFRAATRIVSDDLLHAFVEALIIASCLVTASVLVMALREEKA